MASEFDPSFSAIIMDAIEGRLVDVHTMKVAKVISYDSKTQTAAVQPVMRRAYNIGQDEHDFEQLPPISNVPIAWPRAGGFFIHFPLKKDDTIVLGFTDDNIAQWRETGTESEPDDLKRHQLGNAIGFAGVYSSKAPLSIAPLDVSARDAGLVMGPDGSPLQVCWNTSAILLGRDAIDFPVLTIPMLAHIAKQTIALQALAAAHTAAVAAFAKLLPAATAPAADAIAAYGSAATAAVSTVAAASAPPPIAAKLVKAF